MKLRLLGGYHGACKKWTAGLWLLCLLTWSSRAAAATNSPTVAPTRVPTTRPTSRPTVPPTQSPTIAPTRVPTRTPTQVPTQSPTRSPTQSPTISATTFVWKPDSYRVRGKTLPSAPHGSFNLSLSSNRQIVQGAYKIKVVFTVNQNRTDAYIGTYQLNTSCIPYHASASYIREQISTALKTFHKSRSSSAYEPHVVVQRRGNASSYYSFGYYYHISNYTGYNISATNVSLGVLGLGSSVGCESVLTYGNWSQGWQWNWGSVPGSGHQVNIYQGSGVVALTGSVTVDTLWMEGGTLQLGQTDCEDGWTPSPDTSRNKCFRAFSSALSRRDAEDLCSSLGSRGHLARVESAAENHLVRGLCRSRVGDGSCWIGLRGGSRGGQWSWEEESTMINTTYRSWDWREPNDRKHVDGYENCTVVLSSYQDPYMQARTVWNDEACSARRPYVCEMRAVTTPYTLTASKNFYWRGGTLQGPGNLTLSGVSHIIGDVADVAISGSAFLVNNRLLNVTAPVLHAASSTLVNNYRMTVGNYSTTFAWANSAPSDGRPPILRNSPSATLIVDTFSGYSAAVQWAFQSLGAVRVKTGGLSLQGGGFAFRGSFGVAGQHWLSVGGNLSSPFPSLAPSFQMLQPGMQQLRLSAAYPVADVDHKYGTNSGGLGAFRLKLGSSITPCLSYHISAADLRAALNALSTVRALGNVTVFRWGEPDSASWSYGYHHLVVFDQLAAYNRSANTALSLHCSGSKGGCACLDPVAKFVMEGSTRHSCASSRSQNTSAVVSDRCTLSPSYSVTVLQQGGEQAVIGAGTVYVEAGRHLLPSRLGVNFTEVRGGVALTNNRVFTAKTVTLRGDGMLLLAGAGYSGVDVGRTLYDPEESRDGRETPALLSSPPLVYASASSLRLYNGTLAVASLLTDFAVSTLFWEGGTISGRFNLRVGRYIRVNNTQTAKRLRNGVRLLSSRRFSWGGGNISLAEGSLIQNFGNLTAYAPGQSMSMSYDATHAHWSPARCWSDHGWYSNPLCGGPDCLATPYLENLLPRSRLRLRGNTTVELGLPLVNKGLVLVQDSSQLVLSGGGAHNGTILLDASARLNLTQGSFNMSRASGLRGAGVLVINDGLHQLPASVGTGLKVVAGTALMDAPSPRFLSDVSLHGGLLHFSRLRQNGSVLGNFTVSDGGVLLFRDVHNLYRDRRLADDRSSLSIRGVMTLYGGTLTGNAVLTCYNTLDMDRDDKLMGGGLQLVYYDTCYWGTGDVVLKEDAAIQRHGILQLKSPLNFTARIAYEDAAYSSKQLLQWQS